MASSLSFYNKYKLYLRNNTIDVVADPIKVALFTKDYTFDATHKVWADLTAAAELPTGGGYTQGGAALTNKTLTYTDSPSQSKWDADDVTWAQLTATFRGGVCYVDATKGEIVKPLMFYILFDTTPADIVISGIDFLIQWSANGIDTLG